MINNVRIQSTTLDCNPAQVHCFDELDREYHGWVWNDTVIVPCVWDEEGLCEDDLMLSIDIPGERSMQERMYSGLTVQQRTDVFKEYYLGNKYGALELFAEYEHNNAPSHLWSVWFPLIIACLIVWMVVLWMLFS